MKKLLPFILICNLQLFAQPVYQWANKIGGTSSDQGNSIAYDASGNVYITGYFRSTADFDPSGNTVNITPAGGSGTYDMFLAKYDPTGGYLWAKTVGTTGSYYGYGVAVDGSGNACVTGGGSEILLAKYNSNGGFLWANSFGSGGVNNGYSTVFDVSGNIYVTGTFQNTVDFNPDILVTNNLSSTGGATSDIFFAKYDSDGGYLWAKNVGGAGNDNSCSIALDASGNIYISGNFYNSADFDPSSGSVSTLTSSPALQNNIYFAKYDPNGNYLWAKGIGGGSPEQVNALTVDPASGTIYITGYYDMISPDFDPSAGGTTLLGTNGTAHICFDARYDTDGNLIWAIAFPGSIATGGTAVGQGIAVDASGNTYITGYFTGTVDFDMAVGTPNLVSAGVADVFIAKYDASGNYVCAGRMGSSTASGNDIGYAIAVDATGSNVYTTGYFSLTADFNPDPGVVNNLVSAGGHDIFYGKYDMSACGVLPVGILNFSGYMKGNENLLEWTTSSEISNDYFIVERKGDASSNRSIRESAWEETGKVKGAGNSTAKQNYSFSDQHPVAGMNYYRLKQIDFDGNFSYSKTISIKSTINHQSLTIYPVPSDKELNYEFYSDENSLINVSVMDVLGNIIMQEQTQAKRGVNKLKLNIEKLSEGVYFLRIGNGTELSQIKFVKQ